MQIHFAVFFQMDCLSESLNKHNLMNLKAISILLLLLQGVIPGIFAQPISPFRPLTLPEALSAAGKENKMVMVHFSASWCMPCQWMEKNTFTDQALITFLQERFISVKLDFDDAKTQAQVEAYNVTKLPTILIFNSTRQLIGNHQEMMEPLRLREVLQRYSPSSSPVAGGMSPPKAQMGHLNRPPLKIGNAGTDSGSANGQNVNNAPGVQGTNYTRADLKTGQGLFGPSYPPKKFGVQVGAFSGIENADYMKSELETRYRLPVVVIQDSAPGRASFFKVVIGAYGSDKEAMPLLERMQRDGRQGYIREY